MNGLIPARKPAFRPPAGACDCHMHIYGPTDIYPPAPGSPFPPVKGGDIATYLELRKVLGLTRAVVVQPSVYGFDNSATLDAMAVMGDDARGVAVVPPDVSDAELERLTGLGIRGIRFFMIGGGVLGWDDLERLAARTAAFGWHVQMQMDGRHLHEEEARLAALPGSLVIDHNGKFLEPVSPDHEGFCALRRLIDRGRTWVKTSGVYETSRVGAPDYADVAVLARTLIETVPDRCLFATNWPHPSKPNALPDDARLLDLFAGWCGDEKTAATIMVDNPATVYGFAPLP
ncbi:amidohydrolase family protein [Acetobacter sp. TBRC 12305]|uniref:Amidohydrolase family protein n=1 Tax=Acetobacter garciniae TaxID=2817435 RepID=A0A939HPN5_9PROT|nr:amidohydrolase family protein [Acetobacter garciniae]MBO1325698.1 amidohydrolase family protein [Acetobacter garciniae]MBX0345598.1 amidohydrolase family protein [Acetobacter garciniae]